ncbi:hypothetical protein EDM56_16140 [Brevibacillus fluminis]|uniref:Uncharacterized protein n=1 Tax=Brevibacillus fluminis TaxID=511487 RepID=A0A3M8DGR7_9BACL|nr:hypothetical protein EDM56_16140 [Brevibacillus fluminis]
MQNTPLFVVIADTTERGFCYVFERQTEDDGTYAEDLARPTYSWDELYRYTGAKESEGLAGQTLALRDKYYGYFLEFLELKHPGLQPHELTPEVLRERKGTKAVRGKYADTRSGENGWTITRCDQYVSTSSQSVFQFHGVRRIYYGESV